MKIYEQKFKIFLSDIGSSNSIMPTGILKMLQEIGGLHSSVFGLGLNDFPKTGFAWIVLNWKIKFFKFPCWNTTLDIKTWSRGNNGLYWFRDYEIYDNDELVALASSKWVLYDSLKNTIVRVKENSIKFDPYDRRVFNSDFAKLKEPNFYDSTFEYTVLRKDIDTNHHVNNINYLYLALEALPIDVYNKNISEIDIMYKHSARLGDKIICKYKKISDNEHIVTMKSKDDSLLYSIVRLKY